MSRKHWTEENGKHHLYLETECEITEAATLFRNQDGGWAFEITLFHFAKDFREALDLDAMKRFVEEETHNYLTDEINYYEQLREVLR